MMKPRIATVLLPLIVLGISGVALSQDDAAEQPSPQGAQPLAAAPDPACEHIKGITAPKFEENTEEFMRGRLAAGHTQFVTLSRGGDLPPVICSW